jgi:hypothetical protein
MGKEKSKKRHVARHRPAHLAHEVEPEEQEASISSLPILEQVNSNTLYSLIFQLKSHNPSDREFACSGIANAFLEPKNISDLLAKGASQAIIALLGDPALEVRVEAAGALRFARAQIWMQ